MRWGLFSQRSLILCTILDGVYARSVNFTETLDPADARGRSAFFKDAELQELRGLYQRGVFIPVQVAVLTPDANILNRRFVVTVKNVYTATPSPKAPFVTQGHKDIERHTLIHISTTARVSSIRLLSSISTISSSRSGLWTSHRQIYKSFFSHAYEIHPAST